MYDACVVALSFPVRLQTALEIGNYLLLSINSLSRRRVKYQIGKCREQLSGSFYFVKMRHHHRNLMMNWIAECFALISESQIFIYNIAKNLFLDLKLQLQSK